MEKYDRKGKGRTSGLEHNHSPNLGAHPKLVRAAS